MVRRVIVYLLAVLFTAVAAVPQQVRNGRIYPVASFGTTLAGLTITTNSEPDNGNGLLGIAVPFITGADPNGYSVLDVAYYVQAAVTTSFDLGIYSNTSSAPATLLCNTSTGTITPTNGWNSVAVSGCGILAANTTYWVAYITASNTIDQYRQDNVSCPGTSLNTVFTNVVQATATLPSTFGASTPDANCHNLYAVLSNLSTFGTTFYVSNSGSDANNGKSSAAAWQTISHVNAQSFVPGASILFQAGGTWREALIVTSSGSSGGGPITFGSYGAGAQPIITGGALVTGWTNSSGTIYYATLASLPYRVWNGATELTYDAGGFASLPSNNFDYHSGSLYINVGGDPTSDTIEATQINFPIDMRSSYVTINGLHATKSNYANVALSSSYTGVTHNIVKNCLIDYSGQDGIGLLQSSATAINWTIQNNTIVNNGKRASLDQGIYLDFVGSNTIQYNLITGNAAYGLELQNSANNNVAAFNSFGSNGTGAIAISDGGSAPPTGNQIYSNLSNADVSGVVVTGSSAISGNTVVNNTFYNFTTGGLAIVNSPTNWGVFKNNILWSAVPPSSGLIDDQTGAAGMTSDYNLMGPNGDSYTWHGTTYTSLATYQTGSGLDAHSIAGDPLFVNAGSAQLWLSNGSPAGNAGTTLGSPYNVGLVPGGSWPNSVATGPAFSPPSIGSYLYSGSVWPIGKSSNGRYLVDANNNPWLMVADSPWTLTCKLTPAQQAQYFADRKARGFNSVLVVILPTDYTGCASTQALQDGTVPFTTGTNENNYTYSSENSAYFTEIDAMVNLAATYNLTVLMDPIDTGINSPAGTGSLIAARLSANSSAGMYALGQYLGNRYKSFPNIIWVAGDDFGTWQSATTYLGYTDLQLFHQLLAGIANKDTAHLIGTELNIPNYQNQDGTSPSGLVTLDSVYTYNSTYDLMLAAYNSSPVIPTFMAETNYEYDNDTSMLSPWPGTPPTGPSITYDLVPRLESWWIFTSGGAGEIWGQYYQSTGNFAAANWLGPNGSGYIPYNTTQTSPINGGTISTTSANDLLFYYAANAGLAFTGDAWTVSGFTHPTCVADSGYNAGCSVTSSSAIRSLTAIKVMTTPGWAPASIVSTAATSGEYGTLYAAFRPVSTATPPAFVQANGADTASVAYSSNVTSGNALYAMVFGSPNGTTISVTSTHETFTTVASGVLATDGDEVAIACAIANGTHSDTVTATATGGVSPAVSRIQIYEASGATCALDTSAGGGIDSPGAYQIQYINSFFNSIAWQNMVPDQTHQIVTAGYGTYVATGVAVGQNLLTNNYVTTSWNPNGKLAVIYDPSGNTLTINMAKFTGSVTAQWYDPSNGAYAPVAGSPFSNTGSQVIATPGANSRGSADWVLLLTSP